VRIEPLEEERVSKVEARLTNGLPEEIAKQVTTDVLAALQSQRRRIWRR
jgi:hypothetical protein